VDQIKHNYAEAPVSEKLKSLLAIAGKVQQGGKYVTTEDIERARKNGATDLEIHYVRLHATRMGGAISHSQSKGRCLLAGFLEGTAFRPYVQLKDQCGFSR